MELKPYRKITAREPEGIPYNYKDLSKTTAPTEDQIALTQNNTTILDGGGGTGTASPLTTKGDLWGYSSADTRVPVGTNDQALLADSTNAKGVAWKTIDETKISTSDITTLDLSTSKHGLAPKAPNDATKFLDGTAAWDTVKDSDLSTSDITTNDVSTTKHGFAPKAPNDATKFLDGTGAWDTVKDSDLSTSDITTNDVSTSKHGFAPKAPNLATKYLDGTGAWSIPTGTTYDELDILLGKKFFVDEGIIGSMTLFMRYAGTPTTFSGTGDGSWTARPGQYHCTSNGGLGFYDIGSAKGELLIVLGGMYHATDFPMIGFSANQPTTRNPAALYVVNYSGGLAIQKSTLGGNPATITNGTALNYDVGQAGVAFYYKQSTNMKKIFVRRNGGSWYHVLEESTDATFTTFRYIIFRMHSGIGRLQSPFAAWTS